MGIGIRELFVLVVLLPLYVLPTILASTRKHPHLFWIGVINLVGGLFLGLGWIAALVWTLMEPAQRAPADVSGEIERLHKLVKDGALTQEEFDSRKKMLLQP
jgi:hypothetical protein